MSEIGIYAGGYRRVRDYAESIDRLLLDLKSDTPPSDATVEPVIALLESLQVNATAPPPVRLLGLRWMQRGNLPESRVTGVLSELESRNITKETIDDLESLASLLDQERADMRQRLRGV